MSNCKLGKAMATDSAVTSQPNDASNLSAAKSLAEFHSRASLAYVRSNPRNRISASRVIRADQDLEAFSHPARWQANRLRKAHVEQMRAAARFAHERGYSLNLCIDINWTRTWLGNDPDGQVLSRLMELNRKWLKPRYCEVFAQIAVRENPDGRPNTHILVHCPPAVLSQFKRQVRSVLSDACRRLDKGAVAFKRVGGGNATLAATQGKLDYMCKGISPEEAASLAISPTPQGAIYGKPYSISQDIHRAARRRYSKG